MPNVNESEASGGATQVVRRDSEEFKAFVKNTNPDIVFKDEEGTGADRMMTPLLADRLNALSLLVKSEWPGVKLRITEAWDENMEHADGSLHYEGRAADITTEPKDSTKLGRLAHLAVNAGFHWVYNEDQNHVHVSVRGSNQSSQLTLRSASLQVSPSEVSTDVPNQTKEPRYLAIAIHQAEVAALDAWEGALNRFHIVMSAASDAEGQTNFGAVLSKHIGEKLLNFLASQSRIVSAAKGILDDLVQENARAQTARSSVQLRDFISGFLAAIHKKKQHLAFALDDFLIRVEESFKRDGEAYRLQLVQNADRWDKMRADGWLDEKLLFELIAFEWIRNTTTRSSPFSGESLVRVFVDRHHRFRGHIFSPGGQKIAEQLLKDAGSYGVRPYEWPIRRVILFYGSSDVLFEAAARLTAEGHDDLRSATAVDGDARYRLKELRAKRPTTVDLKGD